MILKSFYFVFFVIHFSFSQVESGEFIYRISSNLNLDNLRSEYKDSSNLQVKIVNKLVADTKSDLSDTEFLLMFKDSVASYSLVDKMDLNDNSLNISKISAKASGNFFFDMNKKIVINSFEYKGKKFNVIDSLSDFEWKITKQNKVIGGYNCFKALGKQKSYFSSNNKTFIFPIEAWFSPEIPIPVGPNGKGGLPGIIMVLKLKTDTYYLSNIKFGKSDKKIKKPKNVITRKKYNEIKRSLFLEKY